MDFKSSADVGVWLDEHLEHAKSILVASPYLSRVGMGPIRRVMENPRRKMALTVITDLDIAAVATGALDLGEILTCFGLAARYHSNTFELFDLTGLHAKVFIPRYPGGSEAVVGSANLTAGGIRGANIELAVRVTKKGMPALKDQIARWKRAATRVDAAEVRRFKAHVEQEYPDLLRALRAVQRLQVFPPKDGDSDYHQGLRDLLQRATLKTATVKTLEKALAQHDKGKPGHNTIRARRRYAQRLGLISVDQDKRVALTALGEQARKTPNDERRRALFMQLCRASPDLNVVHDALFRHFQTGSATYDALEARVGGAVERAVLEDAVRWMLSLHVAEETNVDAKRHWKLKTFRLSPAWLRHGGSPAQTESTS